MLNNRLNECYDTVIAAMAYRIEQLEDELRWKKQRVDELEKLNAALRIERRRMEAMNDDPDADPFGGDGDE